MAWWNTFYGDADVKLPEDGVVLVVDDIMVDIDVPTVELSTDIDVADAHLDISLQVFETSIDYSLDAEEVGISVGVVEENNELNIDIGCQ
jgi:predicted amidohydrolase